MKSNMEDENKAKKIINGIIIIIIVTLVIVLGIIIYKNIQIKLNNDRFNTYIKNNNYQKNENGIYTKTINTENGNTIYQAIIDQYLLTKQQTTSTDTKFTSIITSYKLDGTIETSYKLEGYTSDGNIGTLYQKSTYKNNEFKCEIINNNGFKTQCPKMKEEAQKFEKEINEIFEENNINVKYITLKDKNAVE